MKEVILAKMGELVLKGLNRRSFEDVLIKNIRKSLRSLGTVTIKNSQSILEISFADENVNFDEAEERVSKVFGIASYCRACVANKNMQDINKTAATYLNEELEEISKFKVEAKRSDKKFELKSPEICANTGAYLLENFENLRVDVHNPDVTVMVEIRDKCAYVHTDAKKGAGGMPVGTSGKAAILISGGIDSPVVAWMMAKRGLELTAIHFVSPPYTSRQAEEKVKELIKKISEYCGYIRTIIVPFTKVQEEIKKNCKEELFTVIMRRMMMKLSQKIAEQEGLQALITGESLAQVASQTLSALACTDEASSIPVLRPLIGMDKDEIVLISRKIGTFDISILPYEDCCTVFTPKHPRTKPVMKFVKHEEENSNLEKLLEETFNNIVVGEMNNE